MTDISSVSQIDTLSGTELIPVLHDGAFRSMQASVLRQNLLPRGHIWGMTLSNAADANNDITIAAGECCDETGLFDIVLSAPITKQLDAAWAEGTNQGGLNTGAEANSTWYEVHVAKNLTTGAVDAFFTTTGNRATLPSGYTVSRRVGWIRNDSAGNILAFTQVEDQFTLSVKVQDLNATSSATAASAALTVPPSSIAKFRASLVSFSTATASTGTVFTELSESDQAPSTSTGIMSLTGGDNDVAAAVMSRSAGDFALRVNSSSQIRHRSLDGNSTINISTYGWVDSRGRLA